MDLKENGKRRLDHEGRTAMEKANERAAGNPAVETMKFTVSNVYLMRGEGGTVLVDTCYPGHAEKILERLARAGVEARDISLILLTHGHVDHFGSAAELKRLTGAPVAVHEKDAENLRRGHNPHLTPMGLEGRLMKPLLKTKAPPVEPDVVFGGEMGLEAYGVDARVIETPGHTAGSVSVVTAGGEAIVGDVVAGGYLGFTIRPYAPRYHLFVEDVGAVRESLGRLLDLSPTRLLPGHGGPLDPGAVRARFFGAGSDGRG